MKQITTSNKVTTGADRIMLSSLIRMGTLSRNYVIPSQLLHDSYQKMKLNGLKSNASSCVQVPCTITSSLGIRRTADFTQKMNEYIYGKFYKSANNEHTSPQTSIVHFPIFGQNHESHTIQGKYLHEHNLRKHTIAFTRTSSSR